MNPYEIIDKYYPENTQQRQILVIHSLAVSGKAMKMLDAHPELRLNRSFVKEAALLHDIGIFQTDAPTIQCFGTHPYIAHGYLGAEILRAEGFPQHALVCERHRAFVGRYHCPATSRSSSRDAAHHPGRTIDLLCG
jgi:uncharacterized protein